jgi:hypothetical protein
MTTMRTFMWVCLALASCDKKPSPPPASTDPTGSAAAHAPAAAMPDAATATPDAAAAPALPAGLRALVAAEPLPKLGPGEILLLGPAPGGAVVLDNHGKKLEVRDGLVAKTTAPSELPGGLTYDQADQATIVEAGGSPHAAQVVTRAEDSGGSALHHEVWFVPTVATRTRLAEDASEVVVDWSDPLHRWAVALLDHHASLVDAKTGAALAIGDNVGSPSFAADGTLYYRTLDGGAWRWAASRGEKIGKGARGKPQTGNLNDGIEPAQYPAAVAFDAAGKPVFK